MKHLIACMVLPLLFSCNEEVKDLVAEQGYDFFPVKTGHYRLYEVDEILFRGSEADSSHYFLKEVITDSIIAEDQTVNYLLKRYTTEDTTFSTWKIDSVWTVRRNSRQGIVTENNVPFVKMIFPVKAGQSWNGNALNSRGKQMYYYEAAGNLVRSDMDIPTKDIIRVIIEDIPENLVMQDERSEIYVRGIGLIEKDYISVMFCQSGCSPGQIEDGRIYRQHLVAYGEE